MIYRCFVFKELLKLCFPPVLILRIRAMYFRPCERKYIFQFPALVFIESYLSFAIVSLLLYLLELTLELFNVCCELRLCIPFTIDLHMIFLLIRNNLQFRRYSRPSLSVPVRSHTLRV